MALHACKKCQLVDEKVDLYHHELKWQGRPEWLCVECHKQAFHFHVDMLILGAIGNVDKDTDNQKELAKTTIDRILEHAKKNGVSEAYCDLLLAKKIKKIRNGKTKKD